MTRPDRFLTAWEAEKHLGIPVATIRSWHRRHRATGLFPVGRDPRGRPLFRASDLIRVRRGEKIRDADGEHIE